MAKVSDSNVNRAIDHGAADQIKAFQEEDDSFIQAIAIVDDQGNQVALSGTPLFVSLTGDADSATINPWSGAMEVNQKSSNHQYQDGYPEEEVNGN
jgi:hypothetical protein